MAKSLQAHIAQGIASESGFSIISVFGNDLHPAFAYTVGLLEKHSLELIVCGLPNDYAGAFLHAITNRLKAGETLAMRTPCYGFYEDPTVPVGFMECDSALVAESWAVQGFFYYEQHPPKVPVRYVQALLPDPANKLPWELEYDHEEMYPQALLFRLVATIVH